MWLPGQLIIVSPLIITSLVLHLAYRNLDFSSRLAAYKKVFNVVPVLASAYSSS